MKRIQTLLRSILILCTVALAAIPAAAAPEVAAEVSATTTGIQEPIVLSIVVRNGSVSAPPTLADTTDFTVRYLGPSNSVAIVNGAISQEARFLFRLTPRREGAFKTPAAAVTVGGQVYDIAPIEIKVNSSSGASAARPPNGTRLVQFVSTPTVFVGQQLINTIEIRTSSQLFEPQFGDLTFDGFRHIDIGDDQRSVRVIDGVPTTVITIKKALFPLKSGELAIPERSLRAKVRARSAAPRNRFPFSMGDIFGGPDILDDFFGGGDLKDVELLSDRLVVSVRPLPQAVEALSVWGKNPVVVGHTGLHMSASTSTIAFGDSITVVLDLTSEGNIALIDSVPFERSPDFKVYQEPPQTEVFDSDGTIVTRKRFKVSVVPLKGGKITLLAPKLSYFDPESGVYKVAAAKAAEIEVSGGPAVSAETPSEEAVQGAQSPPGASPAPAERYEELRWKDRVRAQLSLEGVLFVLGAVVGAAAIAWLAFARHRARSRRDKVWQAVQAADSILALRRATLAAVAAELGLSPESPLSAFRSAIIQAGGSSDAAFEVQQLFDDIDAAHYGRSSAGTDFAGLRAKSAAIRAALPRRR